MRDVLSSRHKTALVDYCLSAGHRPNFGTSEILAKANHYERRLPKEGP